jgi:hypothetical protein
MNNFRHISTAIESALQNVLDCDCAHCDTLPVVPATAAKILTAWERRLVLISSASGEEGVSLPDSRLPSPDSRAKRDITREAVHALRMLARATDPVQGAVFQHVLGIDERSVKALMRELRNEWLLPVCATRQRPFGYFVAATIDQLNDWFQTTLNQALSEIVTAYKVRRANFPEYAGQQPLDFANEISGAFTGLIAPAPAQNERAA